MILTWQSNRLMFLWRLTLQFLVLAKRGEFSNLCSVSVSICIDLFSEFGWVLPGRRLDICLPDKFLDIFCLIRKKFIIWALLWMSTQLRWGLSPFFHMSWYSIQFRYLNFRCTMWIPWNIVQIYHILQRRYLILLNL